jgi:PhnB protein
VVRRTLGGRDEVDELQQRPWGDFDGTLTDRYGVPWLLGYQVG